MVIDSSSWKTPSDIIANIVQICLPTDFVLASNMFIGFMPEKPRDCVTVIDSGGGEQDSVNKIDDHSIQILSRSKTYQDGYNALNKIKVILQSIDIKDTPSGQSVCLLESLNSYIEQYYGKSSELPICELINSEEKIIGIWVKSNIAFIGRDELNNSLFSSNYRVMIDTNKNINRN
jgi:hypothetical protein